MTFEYPVAWQRDYWRGQQPRTMYIRRPASLWMRIVSALRRA